MTRTFFYQSLIVLGLALAAGSTAFAKPGSLAASVTSAPLVADASAVSSEQDCVHDLWLVDARRAGWSCCDLQLPPLGIEQCIDGCHWESRSQEDLLQPSAQPHGTILFVHGNRVTGQEAHQIGLQVYRALLRQAGGVGGFRLVVFSWPSDQIHGRINDVRLKAARTARASYLLCHLLDQMPLEEPLGLIGYSFGARIVTGSMQLLSGGPLGCFTYSPQQPRTAGGYRTVLIASALHSHWLGAGQYNGLAITQVDRLLLLNNSCDEALKHYRLIERCSKPAALGYVGLNEYRLLPHAVPIEQVDACCTVGRSHSFSNYLGSNHLMSRVWHTLEVAAVAEAVELDAGDQ